MNDFEAHLERQSLKGPPPAWRAEILSTARRQCRTGIQNVNEEAAIVRASCSRNGESSDRFVNPGLFVMVRTWLNLNRATWGAFALAWMAVIALNVAAESGSIDGPRADTRADSGDLIEGLKEYRAQVARLLDESTVHPGELNHKDPAPPGPRHDGDRPRRDARSRNVAYA